MTTLKTLQSGANQNSPGQQSQSEEKKRENGDSNEKRSSSKDEEEAERLANQKNDKK